MIQPRRILAEATPTICEGAGRKGKPVFRTYKSSLRAGLQFGLVGAMAVGMRGSGFVLHGGHRRERWCFVDRNLRVADYLLVLATSITGTGISAAISS